MTQEHGEATTTKLAPYMGVTTLTQEQAALILRTIWPKAPEVEVFKAALICKIYGLNPLMKHLYLVPFATKQAVIWTPIMGIGATRLIASRVDRYTYNDGPRMMTEQEQKEIRGEVDQKTSGLSPSSRTPRGIKPRATVVGPRTKSLTARRRATARRTWR